MFTGLVEARGSIRSIADDGAGGKVLVIGEPALCLSWLSARALRSTAPCSTVVNCRTDTVLEPAAPPRETFRFQVGPETLLKTNLGTLQIGSRVNLERSLRVGDRLGGHFVQGHIDGVGHIVERINQGEWKMVCFRCPAAMTELMVPKGSIAVDGISLTLVDIGPDFFTVMLIPHTLANTTLGFKKVGDAVNLEADMLAKHVQKLLGR